MEHTSEFNIPFKYKTNRSSPVLWILSHVRHHWFIFLVAAIGAIGNATLAGVPAVQFGKVFEALTTGVGGKQAFLQGAAIVAISQITRGFLQFQRNFGLKSPLSASNATPVTNSTPAYWANR